MKKQLFVAMVFTLSMVYFPLFRNLITQKEFGFVDALSGIVIHGLFSSGQLFLIDVFAIKTQFEINMFRKFSEGMIQQTRLNFHKEDSDCYWLKTCLQSVIKRENYTITMVRKKSKFESGTRKNPIVVFFHGGGFVVGSSIDPMVFRIANSLDAVVYSSEYRLGPEFKYPAGLYDVYDTLVYAITNAERNNGDADKIIVMGVSAGGLYALSSSLKLKQEMPSLFKKIKIILPITPMLSPVLGDSYHEEFHSHPALSPRAVTWLWNQYSENIYECIQDLLCCPLLVGNFRDFPKMIVAYATKDVLRSDGQLLEKKLIRDNVNVTTFVFQGSHLAFALGDHSELVINEIKKTLLL